MKLVESILTKNPCYTAGRKISVKGLMLHSVGCPQPSASVFIKNWYKASYDKACVHGFIDGNDGTVYQTLPWDHISVGVKKSFLLSERHKAHEETTTPSCREHCSGCGVACFGVGECFAKRNVNKEESSDAAK